MGGSFSTMENERESVAKMLRSCLISQKGKMPIRKLDRDYQTMVGERIPFRKFGCKTLEEFIMSLPLLTTVQVGNEILVDTKASQKTSHIAELVQKQKESRKPFKSQKPFRYNNRYNTTSGMAPRYRPVVQKPRQSNQHSMNGKPEGQLFSHNQVVQRSKPSVASRVVVPERSTLSTISQRLKNAREVVKTPVPADDGELSVKQQDSRTNGNVLYQGKTKIMANTIESFVRLQVVPEPERPAPVPAGGDAGELMSAKKRITKMMSEIKLDCDSGTSSPTNDAFPPGSLSTDDRLSPKTLAGHSLAGDVSPFVLPQPDNLPFTIEITDNPGTNIFRKQPHEFARTGEHIKDLRDFLAQYKLGSPEIKFNEVKPKKRHLPTVYHCVIKIGTFKYSTYPTELHTRSEAERYCSELALNDLVPRYTRQRKLLISHERDLLERLPPMLMKHQYGVWSTQLEEDYSDCYEEQMPSNWLEIVDTSDTVEIERCGSRHVLRHCEPGSVLQKGMQSKMLLDLDDVSIPSNTVKFNDDGRLLAQISCVSSVNEVWCFQMDTPDNDVFTELNNAMTVYYTTNKDHLNVSKVKPNSFYVAYVDDNWFRVKALDVNSKDGIHVLLIDYGDICVVPVEQLYKMQRQFAKLQAQAFLCRLAGMEELYEESCMSIHFQRILNRIVVLEALDDSSVDEEIVNSIPVVLYDGNDTEKCLTEDVIALLTLESAVPKIEMDLITEVHVSHIEDTGYIYVQVPSAGFLSMMSLLEELEAQLLSAPDLFTPCSEITPENSEGQLYLGQDPVDGRFKRLQIIDWAPQGHLVQVYYVDHGNANVIRIKEEKLYPLESLSYILNNYPSQALRVRMALGPGTSQVPPEFSAQVKKMMPIGSTSLAKVVGLDDERALPLVEFFTRSQDDTLFCINKSISTLAQLKKEGLKQEVKKEAIKRKPPGLPVYSEVLIKNVPSGGTLPPPTYPTNEYFPVKVPFAVNPWNFFVQPLDYADDLKSLMERLQECYGGLSGSSPTKQQLKVEDIVVGSIYASRHEDGLWYRTSVLKVIHPGSISVFYCDFGYYANLSITQLKPLGQEFMKLPYQALKAKIASIKPKNNKWTMEDCQVFKEMVLKKPFMSVVRGTEKDELYASDDVLNIILVDTTTEKDVYIHRLLTARDIAVSVVD